ncbi:MAG: MFS transporter [Flavobacteriales bacterium]|nr:MFS transporter [Flavobacteriales bacterium]MCB9173442.1 MFS transporter [Flavobacteriales bacterium]
MEINNKRIISAWTFYDWANSVYPLVITTAIFPIFYEAIVPEKVDFFGFNLINTELYSYVVSLSFIIVSILSPILSGVADYSGNKKTFMKFFCYLGSVSCMSLYFFDVLPLEISMVSVLLASVGFWGSLVFYNAYLPEIATPDLHDKISAQGFSRGYIGSSLLLIICLVLIQVLGVDARYSFVLTGLWWIGFSQITYARLPNNIYNKKPQGNILLKGFNELNSVWNQLKQIKQLKRYLGAFFIYSMGVQTVMIMAIFFGTKEISWADEASKTTGLIISVLIIQFIAIPGAYLMAYLSGKIGNIKTIGINIFIWIGICYGAYAFVTTPLHFYIVAGVVGFVMGGIQSLSRSTYSKLLPETQDHASFFSFYDVVEKIGIVIGTFAFGYIEGITNDMRQSILVIILFFIVGFLLLLTIPKNKSVTE